MELLDLVVIDVSVSRIPHGLDSMSAEELLDCKIEFHALAALPVIDNQAGEIYLAERKEDGSWLIEQVEIFLYLVKNSKKVISHNLETDLKLLDILSRRLFSKGFSYEGMRYCTMLEGTPYNHHQHVYRNGKKVPKYPHLQQLYYLMTGEQIGKGDILDDVWQCYICYLALQEKEGASGEIH